MAWVISSSVKVKLAVCDVNSFNCVVASSCDRGGLIVKTPVFLF